jgi:hypothetical protein
VTICNLVLFHSKDWIMFIQSRAYPRYSSSEVELEVRGKQGGCFESLFRILILTTVVLPD